MEKKVFEAGEYIVPIAGGYTKDIKHNHVYRQYMHYPVLLIQIDGKNISNKSIKATKNQNWRYATLYEQGIYNSVNRPINLQNLIYPGDFVICIKDIQEKEFSTTGIFIKEGSKFEVEDTLIIKGRFYIYFIGVPGAYLHNRFKLDIKANIEKSLTKTFKNDF